MSDTVTIKGRAYRCEQDGVCPMDGLPRWTITGKRGHKWFTLRNAEKKNMLFLVSEKLSPSSMDDVWLIEDKQGISEFGGNVRSKA